MRRSVRDDMENRIGCNTERGRKREMLRAICISESTPQNTILKETNSRTAQQSLPVF